jgi:hypothetical protein
VAKIEPRAPLAKALGSGLLDQLIQIAGRDRRGRPGEADQDSDDEAGAPSRQTQPAQQAQAMT